MFSKKPIPMSHPVVSIEFKPKTRKVEIVVDRPYSISEKEQLQLLFKYKIEWKEPYIQMLGEKPL